MDMPLRIERTPEELRIEAQAVLRRLAHDLGVDAVTVNGQRRNQPEYIDQQAKAQRTLTTAADAAVP